MSDSNLDRLQHDLERHRQALDVTLNTIERRLSFDELASKPMEYMQHSIVGEYGANLRDTVSRDPIPITLLGISLAWLMLGGQRTSARIGETLREKTGQAGESLDSGTASMKEKAQSGAANLQDKARDAAKNVQETAHEAAERVRSGGNRLARSSREAMEQVRGSAQHYGRALQEHPLALSFVGLAVGAMMAALIPETQAENRTLGKARDRVAEQAGAKGEQLMEGAKATAQAGAGAAKDEAQRQAGRASP